jgi:hypothetical protein
MNSRNSGRSSPWNEEIHHDARSNEIPAPQVILGQMLKLLAVGVCEIHSH